MKIRMEYSGSTEGTNSEACATGNNNEDPLAAGDTCFNRSEGPEIKSEVIYTFDALRKRDIGMDLLRPSEVQASNRRRRPFTLDKLYLLTGVMFGLLTIQGIVLVPWIYLLIRIRWTMKETFAWLFLLRPFGSMYGLENCGGSVSETCPVAADDVTIPYVPVLGIFFGILEIFITLGFLVWNACRKSLLFYLKENAFLQVLFLVFQGLMSSVALLEGLSQLETRMTTEIIHGRNVAGSTRWANTQREGRCCGLGNYSDWARFNRSLPEWCCLADGCQNEQGALGIYWPTGCYDIEREHILMYGEIGAGALVFGCAVSCLIYVLAKKMQNVEKRVRKLDGHAPEHRILIRRGSKCTAFGGKGKSSHVIRKDGILIEVTGALVSSTGVIEDVVSMEILDWSTQDKIDTTKELDRIVVTVTKHGIVRGKAVITGQDEGQLEHVQVFPTQFGLRIVLNGGATTFTDVATAT